MTDEIKAWLRSDEAREIAARGACGDEPIRASLRALADALPSSPSRDVRLAAAVETFVSRCREMERLPIGDTVQQLSAEHDRLTLRVTMADWWRLGAALGKVDGDLLRSQIVPPPDEFIAEIEAIASSSPSVTHEEWRAVMDEGDGEEDRSNWYAERDEAELIGRSATARHGYAQWWLERRMVTAPERVDVPAPEGSAKTDA